MRVSKSDLEKKAPKNILKVTRLLIYCWYFVYNTCSRFLSLLLCSLFNAYLKQLSKKIEKINKSCSQLLHFHNVEMRGLTSLRDISNLLRHP